MVQFMVHSAVMKVAAFFVVWGLVWLPIAIPLAIKLQWRPPQPLAIVQKIPLVLSLYAIAPLILWAAIQWEHKTALDYGLQWSASQGIALLLGLGSAGLGIGVMYGLQALLGWVVWQPANLPQLWPAIPTTLALGLVVSAVEEPIFRGWVLTQLQADYGRALAAIVASAIFALLHLVWDGKAALPQVPGLCLMGGVLVFARHVDGGLLGLACGLHAGWVWTLSAIDTAQVFKRAGGPAWITGLGEQPLAGLLGLLLLGVTAIALATQL